MTLVAHGRKMTYPARVSRHYAKTAASAVLRSLLEAFLMSTQLTEKADHWEVSIVAAPGGRRKRARDMVIVPKGDKAELKRVLVAQAEKARRQVLVPMQAEETVV